MSQHLVTVTPLPPWVDAHRLLGGGEWQFEACDPEGTPQGSLQATARLEHPDAADLQARLRGVGLNGELLQVEIMPPLKRASVRAALTAKARRLRDTTPGFKRDGVRMDEEGRYSLTPEPLALDLAMRLAERRVLDLTCGLGGNSIAFARRGCEVIAVEQDSRRLRLAQHNARIYGVNCRIAFVHGDALEELRHHQADVLFVDPPWGRDWNRSRMVLQDLPLLESLLQGAPEERFQTLCVKLPASFATATLPPHFHAFEAVFGAAPGDQHRIKYLLAWSGEVPA